MNDLTRFRDRIGIRLRDNKLVSLLALIVVILFTELDTFVPPLGIPLCLLVIWGFLWFQRGTWKELGFTRPGSWIKTILLGFGIALALQILSVLILLPILTKITGELPDYSRFDAIRGNYQALALYLTVSWTTAGIGEEVIWRGYVMSRIAGLGGSTKPAWLISLFLSSVIFGVGHLYQGLPGVIGVFITGMVLGGLYLGSGRNLWLPIFTHGFADSIAFLVIFTGLDQALGL